MDHVQGKDLRRAMEEGETTGGPKDIGKTVNEKGSTELKAIIEKRRAKDRKKTQQGEITGGPKDIGKTVNEKGLKGTESNN